MSDMWLSVDPGAGGSGVVLWRDECTLVGSMNLRSSEASWHKSACHQIDTLEKRLSNSQVDAMSRCRLLVCEFPQVWKGASAQASAARGDVCKLAAVSGMFGAFAHAHGMTLKYVEVNTWKGQLSKKLVKKRIQEVFTLMGHKAATQDFSDHSWDAAGIGLFHAGRFE